MSIILTLEQLFVCFCSFHDGIRIVFMGLMRPGPLYGLPVSYRRAGKFIQYTRQTHTHMCSTDCAHAK